MFYKNLTKISIAEDNFFKMVLIYLRIYSGLPVILMGETGIGKTALIELLSNIMSCKLKILNIHAGVTEVEII